MTDAEQKAIIEKHIATVKDLLFENFGICLNANDFFSYASGDSVVLDSSDFYWALPLIEKYPDSGCNAVMAYIRQTQPIEPWRTPEFLAAYKELEELKPYVWSE